LLSGAQHYIFYNTADGFVVTYLWYIHWENTATYPVGSLYIRHARYYHNKQCRKTIFLTIFNPSWSQLVQHVCILTPHLSSYIILMYHACFASYITPSVSMFVVIFGRKNTRFTHTLNTNGNYVFFLFLNIISCR